MAQFDRPITIIGLSQSSNGARSRLGLYLPRCGGVFFVKNRDFVYFTSA